MMIEWDTDVCDILTAIVVVALAVAMFVLR